MFRLLAELKLLWAVYVIELKRIFSYRADFWLRIVCNTTGRVVMGYFLWASIFAYSTATSFGGYTLDAMVLYYLLSAVCTNSIVVVGGLISKDIYSGSFTRYLLYPVSFFRLRYMTALAQNSVGLLQILLASGVFYLCAGNPEGVTLTANHFLMGCISLLLAGALYYCMIICIDLCALWLDATFSLTLLLLFMTNFFGGAHIPLTVWPESWRFVFAFMPFPFLVSVPVRAFLGEMSASEWLIACGLCFAWILVMSLIGQLIWLRGRYRYQGVGI